MPIGIAFQPNKDYLLVTYRSPLAKGAVLATMPDISEAASTNGTNRILADCRQITEKQDMLELYRLVQEMIKQGVPFSMKEAVILPSNPAIRLSISHYALFSQNRGFQVKEFTNFAEAEAWLTSE